MNKKSEGQPACLFRIPENGKRVIWSITNRCNYSCVYCMPNSQNVIRENKISTTEIKKIADNLKSLEFTHLKITGGEPFIRPDIYEVLSYFSSCGFIIDISTNASLITPKTIEFLKTINIQMIHVSIDGPDRTSHENVRGPDSFEPTINGLKLLTKTNIYIRVGCLIYKGNQDKLTEIAEFCSQLGVKEIAYSLLEPIGKLKGDLSIIADIPLPELGKNIAALQKTFHNTIVISSNFAKPVAHQQKTCPGGRRLLYIDALGTLSPCTWINEQTKAFNCAFNNMEQSLQSYTALIDSLENHGLTGCPKNNLEEISFLETINNKNTLRSHFNKTEKFSRFGRLYSFTTEDIAAYYPYIDFADKTVLCVGSSGDHMINAYYSKAKKATCFDLNLLARYFVELKLVAIKHLSYEDFLAFFLIDGKNQFSYETYKKIDEQLSPATRMFFDRMYSIFDRNGEELRKSELFNNTHDRGSNKIRYNPYLQSKNTYEKTREQLLIKSFCWYSYSLEELSGNNQSCYDIILLSNIADYIHELQHFNTLVNNLLDKMHNKGCMILAYLYDCNNSNPRNDIYRKDIRNNLFTGRNHEYIEYKFQGVLENKEDMICVIKTH
ncbi:MAG TPA: hypothetical protein DCS13_11850 [Candidatus Margulisbacteria bacterium]|nr:MAG: hypothetical protein A2X43_02920 [Candidatus Margulisbacteria bacterium GWD2_39_127]HAR64149.1 hypothetical protein [Candidatus Margulisiibacteriota bacterium]